MDPCIKFTINVTAVQLMNVPLGMGPLLQALPPLRHPLPLRPQQLLLLPPPQRLPQQLPLRPPLRPLPPLQPPLRLPQLPLRRRQLQPPRLQRPQLQLRQQRRRQRQQKLRLIVKLSPLNGMVQIILRYFINQRVLESSKSKFPQATNIPPTLIVFTRVGSFSPR